jgi:hypothetical protein
LCLWVVFRFWPPMTLPRLDYNGVNEWRKRKRSVASGADIAGLRDRVVTRACNVRLSFGISPRRRTRKVTAKDESEIAKCVAMRVFQFGKGTCSRKAGGIHGISDGAPVLERRMAVKYVFLVPLPLPGRSSPFSMDHNLQVNGPQS